MIFAFFSYSQYIYFQGHLIVFMIFAFLAFHLHVGLKFIMLSVVTVVPIKGMLKTCFSVSLFSWL